VVGAASCVGSIMPGCEQGPFALKHSDYFQQLFDKGLDIHWEDILKIDLDIVKSSPILGVSEWCQRIAAYTRSFTQAQQLFLVVGGDNTCSIGTWSGAYGALYDKGNLGLIFIDAHLDSHTWETTKSGALNGMPLAGLLGYGDPLFTNVVSPAPKLYPENICIIGTRSYEKGEHDLLQNLGVRIFYMEEVEEKGIVAIIKQAQEFVNANTVGYGICIDLDVIDPIDAPGVGNPEPNGLSAHHLCKAMTQLADDARLIGFEIVEFNPSLDKEHRTEKCVPQLISAICIGEFDDA
jgi:arginase